MGFTALTAAHGDDRAAEVALALHAGVRRLLEGLDAELVKSLGDGLMLRSPDPGLAIRLGIRIVAEFESVPGFPPVRVGMHHGPAVCREGDWYGGTVNVAARLCAAAGGGEVLVSEATCQAAGRVWHVRFEDRRLHWLKHVTEPVAARVASERQCVASFRRRQSWVPSLVAGEAR